MRLALIGLASLIALAAARADSVPRGKRTERPRATRVVVLPADLDVGGVSVRLVPGVALAVAPGAAARQRATVDAPVQVSGTIDGKTLGARIEHDVDLVDASGAVSGQARRGALVLTSGAARKGKVAIDLPRPLAGRFQVDAAALTAESRELVLPVPAAALFVASAPTVIAAAPRGPARVKLDVGARVEPLGLEDRGWMKVRTYGGFAIEGWSPSDHLRRAGPGEGEGVEAPPGHGFTPSHEALVDAPLYADAAGKHPAGTLRGGAIVTMGVEVSGALVKVMTYGDIAAELWAPSSALRPLEAAVWADH